jgi:hypothetical protein
MSNGHSYFLEIYQPGSHDDLSHSFSSDNAFTSFSKGDILTLADIDLYKPCKVVEIEHIIWEIDGKFRIKTMLFTEEIKS